MESISSVIGWVSLLIIGLIVIIQFYVFYSSKNIIEQLGDENKGNAIADDAKMMSGKSARAKLKWLRKNKSNFSASIQPSVNLILGADISTFILFGILVVLWII